MIGGFKETPNEVCQSTTVCHADPNNLPRAEVQLRRRVLSGAVPPIHEPEGGVLTFSPAEKCLRSIMLSSSFCFPGNHRYCAPQAARCGWLQ